jgi:hypothetical protein
MKISELIARLTDMLKEHGDVPALITGVSETGGGPWIDHARDVRFTTGEDYDYEKPKQFGVIIE